MSFSSRESRTPGVVGILLVFVLGVALLLPIANFGLNRFDEGFIATGAMAVLHGWQPIRDFLAIYGPGQYYVTAALFNLFGEDLQVHRIAHAILLSAMGCGLVTMAAGWSEGRRLGWLWVAAAYFAGLAALMPNAGYPAVLATALLLLAAAALSRGIAEDGAERSLLLGSMWLGLAGLVRWDFGVFGMVAALLAMLVTPRPMLLRRLSALVVPAVIIWILLFLPFVWGGGLLRWWQEIPQFHAQQMAKWRGRPFLRPALWALMSEWHRGQLWAVARSLCELVAAGVPFVLAPAAAVLSFVRLRRVGRPDKGDVLALTLALMALALLNQVRVRSGMPQGIPALIASLPLAPYLWSYLPWQGLMAWIRRLSWLPLLPMVVAAGVTWRSAAIDAVAIDLPRASGLRVDAASAPQWQSYRDLVLRVRDCVPGRLFSGVQDTSRLFINDAMLYFLTDKLPVTRWFEMEPGLTNSASAQAEVTRELSASDVSNVVLWEQFSKEPNATAMSNGVKTLDSEIERRFPRSVQFNQYVLRSVSGAAGDACQRD